MKNVIKPLEGFNSIMVNCSNINSRCLNTKKMLGSGTETLIISNDEMEGIIKIVKYLEDSDLLLKGAGETTQNETKNKKEEFLVCYSVY